MKLFTQLLYCLYCKFGFFQYLSFPASFLGGGVSDDSIQKFHIYSSLPVAMVFNLVLGEFGLLAFSLLFLKIFLRLFL